MLTKIRARPDLGGQPVVRVLQVHKAHGCCHRLPASEGHITTNGLKTLGICDIADRWVMNACGELPTQRSPPMLVIDCPNFNLTGEETSLPGSPDGHSDMAAAACLLGLCVTWDEWFITVWAF